jgi:hypothetical protein
MACGCIPRKRFSTHPNPHNHFRRTTSTICPLYMSAMNWKAQAFIRGCAITNLSIRPETPREVTMSIFALPEELLTHIVAQVISRQDLVHLQLTCKKLLAATLDCREHERKKLSAALDGQMCFHTTANLEKLAISRVRSLSEAMIRSFLVAHPLRTGSFGNTVQDSMDSRRFRSFRTGDALWICQARAFPTRRRRSTKAARSLHHES